MREKIPAFVHLKICVAHKNPVDYVEGIGFQSENFLIHIQVDLLTASLSEMFFMKLKDVACW